jgi:pyrimidine operon attenuation protein / uracil phosphoribosyltransferase
VLVDRGHRELPIQPNYAGQVLDTELDEIVRVHLTELSSNDEHGGPDRIEIIAPRGRP